MTGGDRNGSAGHADPSANSASDFDAIVTTPTDVPCAEDSDKVSEDLWRLQDQLENERDSRREERFYWITALTVACDLAGFPWLGGIQSVLIFFLELMMLIMIARHLGVDYAVHLLNELLLLVKEIAKNVGKSD